jgi:hypothetical protein
VRLDDVGYGQRAGGKQENVAGLVLRWVDTGGGTDVAVARGVVGEGTGEG